MHCMKFDRDWDICPQCGEAEVTEDEEICEACDKKNKEDSERIDELIKQGHNEHCAKRQVWGDMTCECGLGKRDYNPYNWTEKKQNA